MPIKEGIEYGVNEALTNIRSKPINTTPDLPLATRINLLKDKDPKRYQENMQRLIQAEKDGDEEARKLLGEIGEDAARNRRGYEKLATAMTFAPMLPIAGGMAWKAMNNPWLSAGFDVATGNYGDAAVGLATDILPGKIFFNIFKTSDKISDFAADAFIDAYGYKEYLSKNNPIQNEAIERVLKFYNDPEYVKRFEKISDKSNIDKFKRAINDLIFKINYGLKNGNKKKDCWRLL